MDLTIWTWSLLVLDIFFGPLSNMDHPILPITEMVNLVKPKWALDGPFDSSTNSRIHSHFLNY